MVLEFSAVLPDPTLIGIEHPFYTTLIPVFLFKFPVWCYMVGCQFCLSTFAKLTDVVPTQVQIVRSSQQSNLANLNLSNRPLTSAL